MAVTAGMEPGSQLPVRLGPCAVGQGGGWECADIGSRLALWLGGWEQILHIRSMDFWLRLSQKAPHARGGGSTPGPLAASLSPSFCGS